MSSRDTSSTMPLVYIFRRHVKDVLTENGCLPTQVLDRLMKGRIRPGN